MFQQFLRKRARDRRGENNFKARRAERDAEADRARIASVVTSIQTAIQDAEREQTGLAQRVNDALARAAVTLGNGTDEYLEREPLDNYHQDLFTAEIINGQRRLKELETTISHLRFVKAAMLSRFSGFKPS